MPLLMLRCEDCKYDFSSNLMVAIDAHSIKNSEGKLANIERVLAGAKPLAWWSRFCGTVQQPVLVRNT
eukprot:2144760-Amphidinium_carterae.1